MKTLTVIAIAALAGSAFAGSTLSSTATGSAEIRNEGVRLFDNAVNMAFWNAEPASDPFATTGYMQFSMASVAAGFDAEFGAGNWQVDAVQFSLFQDPAGFTSQNATIDFWYGSSDLALTVSGLAGVNYSNALSAINAQQLVNNYGFTLGSVGSNDLIDLFGFGLTGDAAFSADIISGGVVTIAATSDSGNASWAGAGNIRGFANPSLIVTASLVPAPGAMAALGLGGLVATRRRRA